MDFTLNDEQAALADLADRILGEQLPPERLAELERTEDRFPADVWAKLAESGLLGVAVPEAHGGLGFGFLELCLVLEQVGRHVAPVPVQPSLAYGALALGVAGSDAQQRRWLPAVADGSVVLTAALAESGLDLLPDPPTVTATPDGAGWVLSGTKRFVPAAHLATAMVVSARTPDGPGLFLVARDAAILEQHETTSRLPQHTVLFDQAPGDPIGDPSKGGALLAWLVPRLVVSHCAVQAGVCERALRITADYVSEREQFGAKIGTFQAVGQRAADAYIDTEAVRLTMLHAAWRLDEGLAADEEVAIAKFWSAEGAQRVVHAAQHLHGGIGVDTDYPIHRYFRWAKVHELTLGGASQHLARLGAMLAAD